jgi:hypothetical protein
MAKEMIRQQCAVSGFLAALANFMRQSDDRWVAE